MANVGNLLKKMQEDVDKIQNELGNVELIGTDPSGKVQVKANGHKEIIEIKIDPSVVDPTDISLLEDLVLFAARNALKKAEEFSAEKMGSLTQGLPLPNIPGLKLPWTK